MPEIEMIEMADGSSAPKACVDALAELENVWPGATFHTARAGIVRRVLDAYKALPREPYNDNGDMVTKEGQVFRQIGWQINGGEMDGLFLKPEFLDHFTETGPTHGGFSPVYVEVGTD